VAVWWRFATRAAVPMSFGLWFARPTCQAEPSLGNLCVRDGAPAADWSFAACANVHEMFGVCAARSTQARHCQYFISLRAPNRRWRRVCGGSLARPGPNRATTPRSSCFRHQVAVLQRQAGRRTVLGRPKRSCPAGPPPSCCQAATSASSPDHLPHPRHPSALAPALVLRRWGCTRCSAGGRAQRRPYGPEMHNRNINDIHTTGTKPQKNTPAWIRRHPRRDELGLGYILSAVDGVGLSSRPGIDSGPRRTGRPGVQPNTAGQNPRHPRKAADSPRRYRVPQRLYSVLFLIEHGTRLRRTWPGSPPTRRRRGCQQIPRQYNTKTTNTNLEGQADA